MGKLLDVVRPVHWLQVKTFVGFGVHLFLKGGSLEAGYRLLVPFLIGGRGELLKELGIFDQEVYEMLMEKMTAAKTRKATEENEQEKIVE